MSFYFCPFPMGFEASISSESWALSVYVSPTEDVGAQTYVQVRSSKGLGGAGRPPIRASGGGGRAGLRRGARAQRPPSELSSGANGTPSWSKGVDAPPGCSPHTRREFVRA